ncbi:MAG: stalk domain-containing protein [Syntrophomonadaceae bacterium]|nr:stalk domain-containing protein [Syntrophomonadaceae bacterium]
MKKEIRGFIAGVIITMMLSGVALASGGYQNISVLFNSINIKVNGQTVNADNIVYNERTYVPLSAIATMLGKDVVWDGTTNTANINDKGSSSQPNAGYSRLNPAPLGVAQRVTYSSLGNSYVADITVTKTIRGSQAWDMIKSANMFNSAPGDKEEYILAKVKVNLISSSGETSLNLNEALFQLYSGSYVKYNQFVSVVEPEPALSSELYPGAEHEGYITFKVNQDDTNPKAAFGLQYDGSGGVWFNLQ